MTPTATYIAEENCLQLLPTMEKPLLYDVWIQFKATKKVLFVTDEQAGAIKNYDNHLATLRKIPCDTSCKGLWTDGQKLVEGKDYEVKFVYEPGHSLREMFAFPLVPVGEDLWEEFLQSVFDATGLNIANYPAGLKLLKSKYSLTKR